MGCAAAREDQWLLDQFPRDFMGLAADIGANDGISGSNTMALEHAGWQVLCVEPNPEFERCLRQYRELVVICACGSANQEAATFHVNLNNMAAYSSLQRHPNPVWSLPSGAKVHPAACDQEWMTIEVPVARLDHLLQLAGFERLDALSVDTEGTELDVLMGLDLKRWTPRAIICESWDDASPIVIDYLVRHGYRHVERRLVNNLFLKI